MPIGNYGYQDGSGSYFIINTDKCAGCEQKCTHACPEKMLILGEDVGDPTDQVVVVDPNKKKEINYKCSPCNRPCVSACDNGGLSIQLSNSSN